MSDRTDKLEDLFDGMVDALHARIKDGTATAADLNVARQLLASHGVGASRKGHPGLKRLTEDLPFDTDLPN